jgi:hypothetical protein
MPSLQVLLWLQPGSHRGGRDLLDVLSLRDLGIGPPCLRLVAGTLDDREARVFWELRITGGELALIECGAARRLDLSHESAIATQPNPFRFSFRFGHS